MMPRATNKQSPVLTAAGTSDLTDAVSVSFL